MLRENVGAIEPILMQNASNLMQKQAFGRFKCLQPEQIFSELGHFTHVEHLRRIADVPKTVKQNDIAGHGRRQQRAMNEADSLHIPDQAALPGNDDIVVRTAKQVDRRSAGEVGAKAR